MAKIIDGKAIALKIRKDIKEEVEALVAAGKRPPGLAVILVGTNSASRVYVKNKGIACEKAGFLSQTLELDESVTEAELTIKINEFNTDPNIDGILVQLPLPHHLKERQILDLIHPSKDVDGFHPENVGKLVIGQESFVPCTPLGIMKMLEHIGETMDGKEVVIVGRSNIVGKPMAILSLQKSKFANGTVTICHSGTPDIASITRRADVLIAAIGKSKFITKDMVKEDVVIIDVGINRLDDGTLCGDVDYDAIEPIAKAITPVPGGVGPMTIAMLLYNTLASYKAKKP